MLESKFFSFLVISIDVVATLTIQVLMEHHCRLPRTGSAGLVAADGHGIEYTIPRSKRFQCICLCSILGFRIPHSIELME